MARGWQAIRILAVCQSSWVHGGHIELGKFLYTYGPGEAPRKTTLSGTQLGAMGVSSLLGDRVAPQSRRAEASRVRHRSNHFLDFQLDPLHLSRDRKSLAPLPDLFTEGTSEMAPTCWAVFQEWNRSGRVGGRWTLTQSQRSFMLIRIRRRDKPLDRTQLPEDNEVSPCPASARMASYAAKKAKRRILCGSI